MKAQRTIKQKPIFQTLGLALAISALAGGRLAAPASEPANPNAEDNVRIVLKYFQGLSNPVENRVLSGQFTDFGNGASPRLINRIYNQTTHWPAIIGVDYADFASGFLTYAEPNRVAKGYWEQGGLVTISAHLYNPANPRGGGLRDSNVDLASLLDPGTETHARWMRELDLIAAGLQELKDADVVVLWRPFHEMNGGWFWWAGKDSASFIKLWRQMFDYFTKVKHLNNLLWVYAPNQGGRTTDYYPGDHYVDLVGLDAYTDFVDKEHIKGYEEIAELPKPFGFTEYGPHGADHPPGDYDYRQFIAGIKKNFPKTCFFMSWNSKWSLAMNHHAKELLDDPGIVNRENLPPTITNHGESK